MAWIMCKMIIEKRRMHMVTHVFFQELWYLLLSCLMCLVCLYSSCWKLFFQLFPFWWYLLVPSGLAIYANPGLYYWSGLPSRSSFLEVVLHQCSFPELCLLCFFPQISTRHFWNYFPFLPYWSILPRQSGLTAVPVTRFSIVLFFLVFKHQSKSPIQLLRNFLHQHGWEN